MKSLASWAIALAVSIALAISTVEDCAAGKRRFSFGQKSSRQSNSQSNRSGFKSQAKKTPSFNLNGGNLNGGNQTLRTRGLKANQGNRNSNPVVTSPASGGGAPQGRGRLQMDPRKMIQSNGLNRITQGIQPGGNQRQGTNPWQRLQGKNNSSNSIQSVTKNGKLADFVTRFGKGKQSFVKKGSTFGNLSNLLRKGDQQVNTVQQKQARSFFQQKVNAICGQNKKCGWWANLIIGLHCHNNHHWWNYCHESAYWSCWAPCHWHVVYCPHDSSQWYLGLVGTIIPGTGLGIEEVKAYSPAAQAGLLPGQVITRVNGQPLVSEEAMINAIQTSGGRLDLEVLTQNNQWPVLITVYPQRVHRHSY